MPEFDERVGQYRTKKRAIREARKLERETGWKHEVTKTTTWRNLEPVECWTTFLVWQKV